MLINIPYRIWILRMFVILITCYIILLFVFINITFVVKLVLVVPVCGGFVFIHPVNVLLICDHFCILVFQFCQYTLSLCLLCFFVTYEVALYFYIPLSCYCAMVIVCSHICLFYSDYDNNTMLTDIPLCTCLALSIFRFERH